MKTSWRAHEHSQKNATRSGKANNRVTKTESLRRLLSPSSVAVFGGNSAAEVIRQCRALGQPGGKGNARRLTARKRIKERAAMLQEIGDLLEIGRAHV